MSGHGRNNPSRPVRRPTEQEGRRALALDLTRGRYGASPERAAWILWLSLMDVALDGIEGVALAESRDWSKAA